MLKSYSDFISESIWNTTTIRTYFKNGSNFRMYWVPDYDHNWDDDPELKDLEWTEEHFQHTSKELYFVADSEVTSMGKTYYDNLMKDLDTAIQRFVDRLDSMSYPALFSLYEGAYLEFTYDAKMGGQWDEFLLADTDDDHDTIRIYKAPNTLYPAFISYIKKSKARYLNDFENIHYDFVERAEGFEETDLYRSYQAGNKYNVFESKTWEDNANLFFFTKGDKLMRGDIDVVSLKDNDPVKAAKIMFGPNYGKFEMDEGLLKDPTFSDADETYVVVERERKFEKGLNITYKTTLEKALQEVAERWEDYRSDEMFIFKLDDEVRVKFMGGHMIYNDSNDESLIFELDKGTYRFPHRQESDKLEIEKRAFEFFLRVYPAFAKNGKWREKMLNTLPEEQKNLFKSLTSGEKYKLFDYASFNESIDESFQYVQLHSYMGTNNDWMQLTNDPDYIPEEFKDDHVETLTVKLDLPVSYGEKFYVFVLYVDDNLYFDASKKDPISLTNRMIDSFDTVMEGPLGVDEIYGRVAKTDIEDENTKRHVHNFVDSSFKTDTVIHKQYGQDVMKSYDDEIVFRSIDEKINGETIKRIVWNDPEFPKKHELLRTVGTLKKFDI